MDAELRELLQLVAAHGPASRAELTRLVEQRGRAFEERALAREIKEGFVRPLESQVEASEAVRWPEEAYVLTREGAIALGREQP